MSKLQNNFTTVEQSKRLLELGVPVDSADCFFGGYCGHPDYKTIRQTEFEIEDDLLFKLNDHLTPCWSVGRLIEILEIILGSPWSDHEELGKSTLTERVLRDFEDVVKYKEIFKDNRIDFSKLEE